MTESSIPGADKAANRGAPEGAPPGDSASERTQAAIANIRRWNPVVNSMITVTADEALQRAEELDRAAASGGYVGLLHGVTISLKDCIDMEGVRTTGASRILASNVAGADAFVTARLRANGAVIVGKDNLHEWVFGPTSQSRHFGPVRNPWNLNCIAGGSSGGSGASAACGMCVGAIGSDTGGSIRIPAAFNGVAGLRPTLGRVSNAGSLHVSRAFDTLGPLARRVSDVARIFAAIAGHDPRDVMSVDQPLPNFLPCLGERVEGLRIGVMRRWFFEGLDPEVEHAMEQGLEAFRELGVEIVELDLGDVEQSQALVAFGVMVADAFQLHAEQIRERSADYGEDVLARLRLGESVSGSRYAEGMRWMEAWRHRLRGVFSTVDAIFTPTTPIPAPRADGRDFFDSIRQITRFTYPWSAAGVPALAVPCGFTEDGRPLSLQLAGRWFDEPTILRLGHAYQGVTPHHLRRPAVPRGE
jgi:aspartyl-tRNA(Asn)/glutamyl-tRNA(Gln) amidotransferase subunit A